MSEYKTVSREERLSRLKNIQLKRNEARKLNHVAVVEEDRVKKLPKNWDTKCRKIEWEDAQDEKKRLCKEKGLDFNRVKMMEVSAEDSERKEIRKQKKRNPDEGFSSFEQATFRQYNRLTKQMKPDMDEYDTEKEKLGDSFYAGTDTLGIGILSHKDSKKGIDRMVEDLQKQQEKRSKYSRRRVHDDDADIDYINERNSKFNKKLERFYGEHTAEIRQNFERGTAV